MYKRKVGVWMFWIGMIVGLQGHYIEHVDGGNVSVQSFVNQGKNIKIPFKKCFQVKPKLEANKKYINFDPSSLELEKVAGGQLGKQSEINLVSNLRSSQSFKHKDLIVFDDYIMAFLPPKTIQIITPMNNSEGSTFKVTNTIIIKQLDQYAQFKIYKYKQKGLLTIYGSSSSQNINLQKLIFLIGKTNYTTYQKPNTNMIVHLEQYDNGFYAVEFNEGIKYYEFDDSGKKTLTVKEEYGKKDFGMEDLYLVDVNVKHLKQQSMIYVLDARTGVYRIDREIPSRTKISLIVNNKNCEAFDSIQPNHIVMVCQMLGSSFIVEAYSEDQLGRSNFITTQPQYHFNYFNDLHLMPNFYIVFSHKKLHVFWNTKSNDLSERINTESQISLPGLETLSYVSNPEGQFLYTIEGSELKKYTISELQAKLIIKSSTPVQKHFALQMYGNCKDLKKWDQVPAETCELEMDIDLNIKEQISTRKEDFSFSAFIIVILIVVLLLVIWICLKKYKGLEKQARKVLDAYKKKKPSQKYAL